MEVSNSTGQNTDYRVSRTGGDISSEGSGTLVRSVRGRVASNDYDVLVPPPGAAWKVEFRVNGELVAKGVVKNPKASVVLVPAEDGAYRVEASVAPLDAFIIYSISEKKWAQKLNEALRENGVSTWLDLVDLGPGTRWQDQIKHAIAATRNIVVVIGPKMKVSDEQRYAWMIALDAVWQDSNKRFIPILLRDAKAPGLIRSSDRPVAAIRVDNPRRDWKRAVADLVKVLKSEADPRDKGEILGITEEDRRRQREFLSYLGEVAESFRRG